MNVTFDFDRWAMPPPRPPTLRELQAQMVAIQGQIAEAHQAFVDTRAGCFLDQQIALSRQLDRVLSEMLARSQQVARPRLEPRDEFGYCFAHAPDPAPPR